MPPVVGSTDYVLCKGANAAITQNAMLIPLECRGVFNVYPETSHPNYFSINGVASGLVVRLTDVTDGTSTTFAIGEGSGNTTRYPLRQMTQTDTGIVTIGNAPATDPFTGKVIIPDQAWAAASVSGGNHPWYTSVLGVTAQFGLGNNPKDEPMNNPLVMPSCYADNDFSGYNLMGFAFISGFRSLHPGGCNFLFCDGSVRFVRQSIDAATYRALSTYAGGEVVRGDGY
jgi:prepilin-type processing-associated H-X9-DG protein